MCHRPHNAFFYNMDITDWKAQEDIYDFSQKCYGKTIDIVIIIAGILDSSNLINDTEQGQWSKNSLETIIAHHFLCRWPLPNIRGQSHSSCKSQ